MRIPAGLHSWRLTPREAIALQKTLARRVECLPLNTQPRWIAGLDAALTADGRHCLAAVVLWDVQERQAVPHTQVPNVWTGIQPVAIPSLYDQQIE